MGAGSSHFGPPANWASSLRSCRAASQPRGPRKWLPTGLATWLGARQTNAKTKSQFFFASGQRHCSEEMTPFGSNAQLAILKLIREKKWRGEVERATGCE